MRRRSWLAYASAFLVVVISASIVGLVSSSGISGPAPGEVIASASIAWDQDRPSLLGHLNPAPQSASVEEWQQALPMLEEAAADPDNATARRQLAIAYYNLGRLDDARSLYETMLATEENAQIRNRLGNVLRDQGDLEGAEAAYRKSIEEKPDLTDPYLNLAELLWGTHRDEEALAVLQQGLNSIGEESRPFLQQGLDLIQAAQAGGSS